MTPFHRAAIQIEYSDMTPQSAAFLSSLLHALLPSSVALLSNKSGDSRVVVCSVLRRMVPAVLQGCVRWAELLAAQGEWLFVCVLCALCLLF